MDPKEYEINSVRVRQVPIFTSGGKSVMITRVSINVGEHGPFVQDFGQGTGYADTPEAINAWKQQRVSFVMATAGK